MKDYRGPFRPELQLEDLDHKLLATYGRDIMLANHMHDRSGLLPVLLRFGQEAQTQIACDEWMSSSPIYNWRNREYLNIRGDDVSVALKGFQFDIGAPHNYLNFHYELRSPEEGYFWTSFCGPFKFVYDMSGGDVGMQTQICHHMEDPTFDATVMAVHPQMRCRPIYRPPVEAIPDHGPCRWRVSIEDEIGVAEDCPFLAQTKQTLAANFEFSMPSSEGAERTKTAEGLEDYSGPFKPDMCLENLSQAKLVGQCKEFLLHVFLLNYACHNAVAERHGEEHLEALAQEQYHNVAKVVVQRLRKAFCFEGDGMDAILKVLQLNFFSPREYFDLGFAQVSESKGLVWLRDCAGFQEPNKRGIAGLMVSSPDKPGFHRLAEEVNPQAVVEKIDVQSVSDYTDTADVVLAWEVRIDVDAPPAAVSEWAEHCGAQMFELDNSEHRFFY